MVDHVFKVGPEIPEKAYDRPRFLSRVRNFKNCI